MSTHKQVYDRNNNHIGHFDGERFYTFSGPEIDIRVDGNEVYRGGDYIADFDGSNVVKLDGTILYKIE